MLEQAVTQNSSPNPLQDNRAERYVALGLTIFIVFFCAAVIWHDKPIENPNTVVYMRILLSAASGVLGGTIPGFLNIRYHAGGLAIRAAGGLAFAVLTYIYTPTVLPNIQTQTRDQRILLDIVLASQRRPKQFTDSRSIDASVFDVYMNVPVPHDLLFNLFIQRIVLRRTDPGCDLSHRPNCEIELQNYPASDLQLEAFQAVTAYLIDLGLTTEKSAVAPIPGTVPVDAKSSPASLYGFCFKPRRAETSAFVPGDLVCGHPKRSTAAGLGTTSVVPRLVLSPRIIDVLGRIVASHFGASDLPRFAAIDNFSHRQVSVEVHVRSTQTVVDYLGEVIRRQLYPDLEGPPRIIKIKTGPPFNRFPYASCYSEPEPPDGWRCLPLFVLNTTPGSSPGSAFSVSYEGVRYSIPDTDAGASYKVLSIIGELLMLNTNGSALASSR